MMEDLAKHEVAGSSRDTGQDSCPPKITSLNVSRIWADNNKGRITLYETAGLVARAVNEINWSPYVPSTGTVPYVWAQCCQIYFFRRSRDLGF